MKCEACEAIKGVKEELLKALGLAEYLIDAGDETLTPHELLAAWSAVIDLQ